MFQPDDYELLDLGAGRKLERLAGVLVDRPAPVVEDQLPQSPRLWKGAQARYRRTSGQRGQWDIQPALPEPWTVRHGAVTFELRPTPFGHLGLFPEQAENWDWLTDVVGKAGRPLRLLNLFAHTGGSTLAAAAAGAEVTHVDSAGNVIGWARRNAELSGLADHPIRWICEDAMKFAAREVKRGRRYDGCILDPPTYGHGPKREVWQLEEDLPRLLETCAALVGEPAGLILLTCHTQRATLDDLAALLRAARLAQVGSVIESGYLSIRTVSGRELPGGVFLRAAG